MSSPSTLTDPAVAAARPSIIRMVVVFPEPLGPRNPNTDPPRHGQVDAVHGQLVAEALGQPPGLDSEPGGRGQRTSPRSSGGLKPLQGYGPGEHPAVVGEQDVQQGR